jgi:hypothetical protein
MADLYVERHPCEVGLDVLGDCIVVSVDRSIEALDAFWAVLYNVARRRQLFGASRRGLWGPWRAHWSAGGSCWGEGSVRYEMVHSLTQRWARRDAPS